MFWILKVTLALTNTEKQMFQKWISIVLLYMAYSGLCLKLIYYLTPFRLSFFYDLVGAKIRWIMTTKSLALSFTNDSFVWTSIEVWLPLF